MKLEKNLNVIHVINGEIYAGAERVQDHLIDFLSSIEHVETSIIAIKKGVYYDRSKFDKSKIDFTAIISKRASTLSKIFNEVKPDVIHCHTPMTLFYTKFALIFANYKSKVVFHIHSPVLYDTSNKFKNYIKYLIEKMSFSVSQDIAICVSHSVKSKTPYLKKAKNCSIIHNGVETFKQNIYLDKPHLKPVFRIGFAGFIRERKGIEVLLTALSLLKNKHYDIELQVVGDFENINYKEKSLSNIKRLGLEKQVEFLGFSSNLLENMKEFDCFALPSLYGEGLPMVVIEAMSLGIPVIASSIDGLPEVIDGSNGLLFPSNDSHLLAENIAKLIDNRKLCLEISVNAYATQLSDFSVESMGKKIMDAYING
jgi:glycosyltransferase involved in cell wall biosynthesis